MRDLGWARGQFPEEIPDGICGFTMTSSAGEMCWERGMYGLIKLKTMQEDLASMGHSLSNDDMYAIALSLWPPSYNSYISAMSAMLSVLGTTISADALITTITDKYDHQLLNLKGSKKKTMLPPTCMKVLLEMLSSHQVDKLIKIYARVQG